MQLAGVFEEGMKFDEEEVDGAEEALGGNQRFYWRKKKEIKGILGNSSTKAWLVDVLFKFSW